MPKNITDQEILQDILEGRIVYQNGTVFTYDASKHRYVPRKFKITKGRRFYEISKGQRERRRKSSVSGAKLIWMTVNRRLVPAGMDIEHKDGDNTNDYPSNLILREKGSNRSDNNGATMSEAYTQGRRAAMNGDSSDNNPYSVSSERWHDWERGFLSDHATGDYVEPNSRFEPDQL